MAKADSIIDAPLNSNLILLIPDRKDGKEISLGIFKFQSDSINTRVQRNL